MGSREGYRDYFKVLGVDRHANTETIKKSFRTLARKYHPDVNPGNKQAEAKFKEITEAYEVLSDPEKRKRYDQFGKFWNQSGNTSPSGFDVDFGQYGNFDEFINELLGRFGGPRSATGFPTGIPNNVPRSALNLDAEVQVRLSFSEAFHGTERTLSVNQERVKVRIPQGIRSGSRLRLQGKGNFQPGTGRRGDLYLNLEVTAHELWKLDGNTIRANLPVSMDELVLGTTIKVLIPDGEAEVTIPPCTTPGKSLRLKGKGWPLKNGRGDLILMLSVQFPDKWSNEELELLRQLQRIRSDDPRQSWSKSACI